MEEILRLVNEILGKTKDALISMIPVTKSVISEAVDDYIHLAKDRYHALLTYMKNGGDTKFLLERLKDEKEILKSQLLSLVVIGLGIIENIANKVQDILISAVRVVLPVQTA